MQREASWSEVGADFLNLPTHTWPNRSNRLRVFRGHNKFGNSGELQNAVEYPVPEDPGQEVLSVLHGLVTEASLAQHQHTVLPGLQVQGAMYRGLFGVVSGLWCRVYRVWYMVQGV